MFHAASRVPSRFLTQFWHSQALIALALSQGATTLRAKTSFFSRPGDASCKPQQPPAPASPSLNPHSTLPPPRTPQPELGLPVVLSFLALSKNTPEAAGRGCEVRGRPERLELTSITQLPRRGRQAAGTGRKLGPGGAKQNQKQNKGKLLSTWKHGWVRGWGSHRTPR